jgi:hypothetical protein
MYNLLDRVMDDTDRLGVEAVAEPVGASRVRVLASKDASHIVCRLLEDPRVGGEQAEKAYQGFLRELTA